MDGRRWQRLAGWAGVLYFAVTIAGFFTPTTPDAGEPSGEIARQIAADRAGHVADVYLAGLATLLFLAFAVGVAARLREGGGSSLATAGAVAAATGTLTSGAITLAMVRAADAGRDDAAVRALFELGEIAAIPFAFALAAFYGGVALSALPSGGLPRGLAWAAAAIAGALVVGLLGLFSRDQEEGGPLGIVLTFAILGQLIWILAVSARLLRAPEAA